MPSGRRALAGRGVDVEDRPGDRRHDLGPGQIQPRAGKIGLRGLHVARGDHDIGLFVERHGGKARQRRLGARDRLRGVSAALRAASSAAWCATPRANNSSVRWSEALASLSFART